jgi:hypothetical protein
MIQTGQHISYDDYVKGISVRITEGKDPALGYFPCPWEALPMRTESKEDWAEFGKARDRFVEKYAPSEG